MKIPTHVSWLSVYELAEKLAVISIEMAAANGAGRDYVEGILKTGRLRDGPLKLLERVWHDERN
jgi:hypothetical protein